MEEDYFNQKVLQDPLTLPIPGPSFNIYLFCDPDQLLKLFGYINMAKYRTMQRNLC